MWCEDGDPARTRAADDDGDRPCAVLVPEHIGYAALHRWLSAYADGPPLDEDRGAPPAEAPAGVRYEIVVPAPVHQALCAALGLPAVPVAHAQQAAVLLAYLPRFPLCLMPHYERVRYGDAVVHWRRLTCRALAAAAARPPADGDPDAAVRPWSAGARASADFMQAHLALFYGDDGGSEPAGAAMDVDGGDDDAPAEHGAGEHKRSLDGAAQTPAARKRRRRDD